jgi:predicted Zn-dependent protease
MKSRNIRVLASAALLAALTATPWIALASDASLEAQAARDFARIKATAPLTTDEDTISYISCVANSVVQVLDPPHSEYNWEMVIIDTNEINAMVMPGGKIIVYEGILQTARNQHQLAAVMGHEIAHETANHTKSKLLQGGRGVNIGIKVAAVLLGGGHYGATYTAQEALSQGAMYGLLLPYKRNQETEADVIGLEYMAKAGFDPRESVPLWKNMAEFSGKRRSEFSSTHPSSDKRIDSLVSQWVQVLPLYNQAHQEGRVPNCVMSESVERKIEEMAEKTKKQIEKRK